MYMNDRHHTSPHTTTSLQALHKTAPGSKLSAVHTQMTTVGMGHGARTMDSAIKTSSTNSTDNSLRMESIARGSAMRAFGARNYGMHIASPGAASVGFGSSSVGVAHRVSALVSAVILVFGVYSVFDTQYTHFVYTFGYEALLSIRHAVSLFQYISITLVDTMHIFILSPESLFASVMKGTL